MPRYICKIEDKYFEWSTIVDAPVTYGMTLEEFTQYYREEYGEQGMRDLPERMERVEAKGTSALAYGSLDELLECNRAGENDEELTREEIAKTLIPSAEG